VKKSFSFLLIFILIFSVTGCKKESAGSTQSEFEEFNPDIHSGGTVEAYILRPDTLNPITTGISANRRILSLCYDSLFYLDSGYNLIPRLAESYTVSEGGKKIRIKLRHDVTWHDGSKFTAADVVYTVNNIVSSENSYYRYVLDGLINKIRTVDNYTVDFYLNYANSGAPAQLVFPILKKGTGFSEGYTPIGTGPFKLKGSLNDSVIALEKNPKWKFGHVYIDGVNLNILPDENAVYSAFSTGVIDFVQITKDNAGKFSVSKTIGYLPTYTDRYTFVGLNCNNPLFAVTEIRQAIYNTVDTEAFAKYVLSDYGIGTNLPIHPQAYYYNKEKPQTATENIIKEEGKLYYCPSAEKIPLTFTLLVNEENHGKLMAAEHFAAILNENGFTVELTVTDYTTYKSKIAHGEFDMYLGSTQLSPDANLHPILGNGGNLNYGYYYSDSLEALMNDLISDESLAERSNSLQKLQQEIYVSVPHIPLYFENEMIVYNSKKIGNVHPVLANDLSGFLSICCVNE